MIRTVTLAMAAAALATQAWATDGSRSRLDELIAVHAKANKIPESIVHRVVKRESRYNPRAVGRGGAMGLMQIKHGTARALGYSGSPSGLLDADTNLTYAVKYLAGAYRTAKGDPDRTVSFYARGYYYAAKRNGVALEPAVEQAAAVDEAATPSDPVARFFMRLTQPEAPQTTVAQAQVQAEPAAETGAERRRSRRLARLERAKARALASAKVEPAAGPLQAVKETAALSYAASEPAEPIANAKAEPAKSARRGGKAKALATAGEERVTAVADAAKDGPETKASEAEVPLPPKRDRKLALRTTLPGATAAPKDESKSTATKPASPGEAETSPAGQDAKAKSSATRIAKVQAKAQKARVTREAVAQDPGEGPEAAAPPPAR